MKKKKKNPALIVIFIIALFIFLFAVIKLGSVYFRYQKEDSVYKNLENYAAVGAATPENEKNAESAYVSPVDFSSLQEINPDTVGWIYFETMDINYPIVQGEDDDFYLHHSFEKEESVSGCIFLDTESAPDFSSDNSFVYGHNMKDKSMFLIYTPTETRRYEIYSCYPAALDSDSFTYSFENKEDYAKWQDTVKNRSLYDTGVTPDPEQPTVTLMTCTPKGSNYRFLVHAKLKEVIR